jgi:hypothetical protein
MLSLEVRPVISCTSAPAQRGNPPISESVPGQQPETRDSRALDPWLGVWSLEWSLNFGPGARGPLILPMTMMTPTMQSPADY